MQKWPKKVAAILDFWQFFGLKFSKLLHQICEMPHREGDSKFRVPSEVCCEFIVLRFEGFACTVPTVFTGVSRSNSQCQFQCVFAQTIRFSCPQL